jgi:hypothetical protein
MKILPPDVRRAIALVNASLKFVVLELNVPNVLAPSPIVICSTSITVPHAKPAPSLFPTNNDLPLSVVPITDPSNSQKPPFSPPTPARIAFNIAADDADGVADSCQKRVVSVQPPLSMFRPDLPSVTPLPTSPLFKLIKLSSIDKLLVFTIV